MLWSPRTGARWLLELLVPPRCAGCDRRGAWLCDRCQTEVAYLTPPWCDRCGEPLAQPGRCAPCRRPGPVALDVARAACAFDGPVRQAIHRFKYQGERGRAAHLAALVAGHAGVLALAVDCLLVPVPLDARRRRERGYNQAEALARELARLWACPCVPALARTRPTRPQVGLDRAARLANVRGAFAWRGVALTGARALLVDDVMTTGATAEACAVALKAAGAVWVGLVTIARPRHAAPW